MELETLRTELNLVNAELYTKNQALSDLALENERLEHILSFQRRFLMQEERPVYRIIAERVKRNAQMAAFMTCGLVGIAVGQVKRVKLPRLRVDWQ